MFTGLYIIIHETIKHGLKSGFVPGRIGGFKNRSDTLKSGCVSTGFVVNNPYSLCGLVYPVDISADIYGLYVSVCFNGDRYIETVFHGNHSERADFFIVLQHLSDVFFNDVQY